jgi:hypothetical protein
LVRIEEVRTPMLARQQSKARDQQDVPPLELISAETNARRELEKRRGQAFSDQEWVAAKDRLLAFARLVQTWDKL